MSLDIGDALREGGRRLVAPDGLQLLGALLVVGLANAVVVQSFYPAYAAVLVDAGAELPPNFPPPTPLAVEAGIGTVVAAALALALLAEAVRIVGIRALVREEATAIPAALATRRIGRATANGYVAGVVVYLLSFLAAIALVVPGLFVMVALFFVRQAVAVEDRNFAGAVERSWTLTKGARLEVFVLWVVFVGLLVGSVAATLLLSAALGEGSVAVPLVRAALNALLAAFGVAVTSRAYVQLTDDDGGDAEATEEEEWPDPPGVDV